ncbi:proactivator polypeptide-like 1 [Lepus europaeus]|uniref:proactivator polypeptide-like 1 n=1 Tax=Lepus europaeus TaxID=9983 RepID=UPI002B49A47B|nr:proactivator polypeptide-like 1 [Lepus europaeus]
MLCALLLLPGLLGTGTASPMAGPQLCARGSAQWCRDLQAAASCGAVGHCRSTVWSQPTARSLPCDVCRAVAAASADGLNPEATGADSLAAMTKTCEWLPSQESSARCKRMVEAHSPAVLSLLGGGPDAAPARVCTALALCEPLQRHLAALGPLSQEDAAQVAAPFLANGALSFHPPPVPEGAVCRDCVRLVARLQDALQANLSLAEVDTHKQCESLGPGLGLLCDNYLRQVSGPAERSLRLLSPQDICGQGGFCEQPPPAGRDPSLELVLPGKKSEVQMKAGLTCEVCLDVVQELDRWLLSNRTEDLIDHALERVCAMMPTSMVQQCVSFVDTYSPSLVQLVAQISPETVCTAIRLCNRRRRARATHGGPAELLPLSPGEETQGRFCGSCRRLLGVSSQNLERSSTRRDILNAFKGGCSILPLPYKLQCTRFVTQYQPIVIQSLKEMMDPVTVCSKLGACHGPRAPVLLGTDQCVLGPSFWCGSLEAAEMCGATQHCQRLVWQQAAAYAGKRP